MKRYDVIKAIQSDIKRYETIWSDTNRYEAIRVDMKRYEALRGCMKRYKQRAKPLGHHGQKTSPLDAQNLGSMNPKQSLRSLTKRYEAVQRRCNALWTIWAIWIYTKRYDAIWSDMKRYETIQSDSDMKQYERTHSDSRQYETMRDLRPFYVKMKTVNTTKCESTQVWHQRVNQADFALCIHV
jgi:hypothetical protein